MSTGFEMCEKNEIIRKLTLMEKIHYGFSGTGNLFPLAIIRDGLLIYYVYLIGMNPILFGIAFLIFGVWNAINDPLLGYYSDRAVLKGKKRTSLMKISIPIFLAGFLMVVVQSPKTEPWLMFIILILGLILYEAGGAIFAVNNGAYGQSAAQDPDERSKLGLVFSYVSIIPGALVGLIPIVLLSFSYIEALFLFVMVTFTANIISTYSIYKLPSLNSLYLNTTAESRIKDTIKTVSIPQADVEPITVKNAFKETLKSKPFHYNIYYRLFASFYQATYLSNIIFMMKGIYGIEGGIWPIIIAGIGGLVINILYPFLTRLRSKLGTINALMITQVIAIPGYIIMGLSFDIISLLIGYAISTVALSGLNLLEPIITGDVTDKDYFDTKKEKRGLFLSIKGFFTTLTLAIAVFISTILLDVFEFNSNLLIQTEYTQLGLRIMAAVIPITGLLLGIIMLKIFPLQGEKYAQFREKYVKFLGEENVRKKENVC